MNTFRPYPYNIQRRLFWDSLTVAEYERALLYHRGQYARTVGAGTYTLWKVFSRESAVVFDMRKASVSIAGQEIVTKDRVPVRITLVATYQVVDPVRAQHEVEAWREQIYLDLQLALREFVAGLTFDELLDARTAIGQTLSDDTAPRTMEYGVQLLRVQVKDISMPASIREMMLKTVEAEKSAQASLIRAREEVAAARARANTARMIADTPAILRLKELETIGDFAKSSGNTIVFGGIGGDSVARLGKKNGKASKKDT